MSKQRRILLRPVVSEKMTKAVEASGTYGFVVERKSNKVEIRQAVESQYGVTVASVRTMVVRGKDKTRYTKTNVLRGATSAWKKAVVTLKKGDVIELYGSI
jgi:large subunit ribosomal protein L23